MKTRLCLIVALLLSAVTATAQRYVRSFPTIDALLAATPADVSTNAWVAGRNTPGDGGGGSFYYSSTASTTTNLGTVFKPNNASGRWLRDIESGDINVIWFGAVPNKSTDSTAAFKDALWFAAKPTYGPIFGAASGYAALGVYVPPGEYKTTASLTNYGVNFHGKATLHGGNYNADTVIHSMHSGPFMISDYGGVTGPLLVADYRLGRAADIAVEGYPETYPGTKVSILSVTDRLNFTVAIGSLPVLDTTYPEVNLAFFYDDQGRWLGSGRIASVNTGTGLVTLATDRDVYSTVGGSLLRTSDKVVFSPVIAQESTITNFTDPASAGPCGFYLKCSYAGVGLAMEIDNVLVSNFHVGVRVGPGLLERRVKNLKAQACKFAAVCFPRESNCTDSPWLGFTYVTGGYRSDYGTSFSNTITNPSLCNTTAGFYGLGALDRMDDVLIEGCSYAQMAILRGLSQRINFAYFDLCVRHGLVLFRGYTGNATNSVYNNAVTFGSFSARTAFAGYTKFEPDPVHYERFAVDVPNSDANTPALLNLGMYSVEDGGAGDFYSGIRTTSGVGNIVQIGQVTGRNGSTVSFYTNQAPTVLAPAKNLSLSEVYNGVFESAVNKIGVASEGYLPAEFAKTGVTIMATNSITPLTMVRSDTGKKVSFVIGTDTLLTRNESQSVYFNTANADTTFAQFSVGANGTATAPRLTVLSGEVANSGAGIDVAANDFYIGANRGTGASTSGGRLMFQTPDATASGTSPQNGSTKLKLNREGQLNFVPRSTDPTVLVGAGDLYYNSASNAFRVFNGSAWKQVRTGTDIRISATLDFPSTSAQSESALTVSVPGAVLGDVVALGIPNASTTATSVYSAWVSATDTVTVRFSNYGAVSRDPVSGTFTLVVEQY